MPKYLLHSSSNRLCHETSYIIVCARQVTHTHTSYLANETGNGLKEEKIRFTLPQNEWLYLLRYNLTI